MLKTRIRRCIRFASSHMLGRLCGKRSYTRFIILSTGRSGTNLLRGLLNSHGGAIAFGELFRFPHTVGWDTCRRKTLSPSKLRMFHTEPGTFLQRHVFEPYPARIGAVGFKLFYDHAPKPPQNALWPHLESCRDLHVLHVQRDNLFKRLVSREQARAGGQWIQVGSRDAAPECSISLTHEQCLADFKAVERCRAQCSALFHGHPYMELVYEDLTHDLNGTMSKVFDFLSLPPGAVVPMTQKQRKQPPGECVENYAELKASFAGTSYARFFND